MTSLRRLLGIPRLPIRIYALVLAMMLILAYIVTGPSHHFYAKLHASLGHFYEPTDFEREDHAKGRKRCFHDLVEEWLEQMKRKAEAPGH